ncbi:MULTISPECIES: type II toxin-antitoxin system HicA family toxin [Bacillus]|uniref:type II toxin-antitoxin system HicA family toxin n=1 Tax=Bacillus TaxID=1386 RepID=UPI0009B529E3|nr:MULTISPECIES: type II toxin-antitoxin system HicA family toxin [Bacillus]AZV48860.1 type II toxin-antitoxin system HicA family toxin [Bacillus halotolerans]MBU2660274.1 type II toxin-antitoxin system HicA family toxin [Bacillus cabrialesii]MDO3654612.1 type II toxin-antitoxin system HicA family toxin [Bacillus subtilis]MED0870031.1 type II toxin-antitoxin system HicA family toxin [Bacillus spizizenii]MED1071952.1 type II toxin-antitoxin system HicA family toxin [Bacillus spizizenii]
MKKLSMFLLSFTILFAGLFAATESASATKYVKVGNKKFSMTPTLKELGIKKPKVMKAEMPWGTGAASAKQVIKFLKSKGFSVVSQKGSHVKLKNSKGKTTIVPSHGNKSLAKGTLNSILKQAGIK